MSYDVRNFDGLVITKHSIYAPNGRAYSHFCGKVSILPAAEMLGFEVQGNETNWIARVESPDRGRSINLPGCQVQAVLQGEFETGEFTFVL